MARVENFSDFLQHGEAGRPSCIFTPPNCINRYICVPEQPPPATCGSEWNLTLRGRRPPDKEPSNPRPVLILTITPGRIVSCRR
ncbi:hypothetical protein CDAR_497311 [Caerostris darwini]|uniref:Uncharacterized protein n=1 Tax=Caerostris darwini TaxID=1538125 RepID=A0AAV4S0S4_9ARAC|nr:hypothetical protein CDAR_497311 [Caerostris darwini]